MSKQQDTIYAEYFGYYKQHSAEYGVQCVVLIECGAFYECYGVSTAAGDVNPQYSNIVAFAEICGLNVVAKTRCTYEGMPVVMAGFKSYMLDKFVTLLHDANYVVLTYDQKDACKNTSRHLTRIYSPGTYVSMNNAERPEVAGVMANNIVCIWLEMVIGLRGTTKTIYIAAASLDIITGKTVVMEYADGASAFHLNANVYDELERFLSIHVPKEVIVIASKTLSPDMVQSILAHTHLEDVYTTPIYLANEGRDNAITYARALHCEKQKYQQQILMDIYQTPYFDMLHLCNDMAYAVQALCFLLEFVRQHEPKLLCKVAVPEYDGTLNSRVTLSNSSLRQLDIIPNMQHHSSVGHANAKCASVVALLNDCITPMGRRLFRDRFLHPISDAVELERQYGMTAFILTDMPFHTELWRMLTGQKDLNKLYLDILLRRITPKSISDIHRYMYVVGELLQRLTGRGDVWEGWGNFYFRQKTDVATALETIKQFIEQRFSLEVCMHLTSISSLVSSKSKDNNDGADADADAETDNDETAPQMPSLLKRGIDLEYDECYDTFNTSLETLRKFCAQLNALLLDIKKPKNPPKNPYVTLRETDKMLLVTVNETNCKLLKAHLATQPHIDICISISELEYHRPCASYYEITSPTIRSKSQQYIATKSKLIGVLNKAYTRVLAEFEALKEHLDVVIDFVSEFDVQICKAHVAHKYGYCRPTLALNHSTSHVCATALRHCLIERRNVHDVYVGNDVALGVNSHIGMLLYGTNAVGKSSYMKAIGIALIMAQSGCYVPAQTFEYWPYHKIFTRIFTNDNLFENMSAFTVEMVELCTIVRFADEYSIVLGDELCSGTTDNISAINLILGGITHLCAVNASFIFSTHLHELLKYPEIAANAQLRICHMKVLYNPETNSLKYVRKICDGAGPDSYGLEVIKAMHFPAKFMSIVHGFRDKYFPALSNTILDYTESKYNAAFLKAVVCQVCGVELATDVHHERHQAEANGAGHVLVDGVPISKHHASNLTSICRACHAKEHR